MACAVPLEFPVYMQPRSMLNSVNVGKSHAVQLQFNCVLQIAKGFLSIPAYNWHMPPSKCSIFEIWLIIC